MYGIIDIGSNTIRLNVYKVAGKQFSSLFHSKISAGLANYREDGRITMEGIHKATSSLHKLKLIADNLKIKNIYAFATASLRNVSNGETAKEIIEQMTGIPIDLLSGEEEGRLGFRGAMYNVTIDQGLLIDIGGGSTELVSFDYNKVLEASSLDIGSLSMYLQYVDQIYPTLAEAKKISKAATKIFRKEAIPVGFPSPKICGVGGTLRALLDLHNFIFEGDPANRVIDTRRLPEIIDRILSDKYAGKNTLLKVCPDRIHTIVPGILIVESIVEHYDSKEIVVSSYGVREGYLVEKVLENRR